MLFSMFDHLLERPTHPHDLNVLSLDGEVKGCLSVDVLGVRVCALGG